MKQNNALLLAPPGLDIYKDVIAGLEEKGYCVDYVSSSEVPNNPFKPIFDNRYNEENVSNFEKACTQFWEKKFLNTQFSKSYDVFFSIDGLMVCPYLFNHLKEINPGIKCKLFLYDKIEFACHVERYFCYYDDVFSFDLGDVASYNLKFLPIYWVSTNKKLEKKYDIFGMATYSLHKKDRAKLFREIKTVVEALGLKSFVKLYVKMDSWPVFLIKNFVKLLKRHKTYIPFVDVYNGIVTNKSLSPKEFRDFIYESEVIIDTHVEYQDGLTARFMWALGAEKKIVTTNKVVKKYNFYTPEQFFIIGEDSFERLGEFVSSEFLMSEKNKLEVLKYRMDYWLETIIDN